VLLGIVHFEFLKLRVAVEELLVIRDAVILDPIVGANKPIRKPAHVSLPIADQKIEITRSIAGGRRQFTCCCIHQCELQDAQPIDWAQFHTLKADDDYAIADVTNYKASQA
jgi:hypothetical protein